jgi:hypothetical protein
MAAATIACAISLVRMGRKFLGISGASRVNILASTRGVCFEPTIIAGHSRRTGPGRPGVDVRADCRHKSQVLHFPGRLQAFGKGGIEIDINGTMLIQGELGRVRSHTQNAKSYHIGFLGAQRIGRRVMTITGLNLPERTISLSSACPTEPEAPRMIADLAVIRFLVL